MMMMMVMMIDDVSVVINISAAYVVSAASLMPLNPADNTKHTVDS